MLSMELSENIARLRHQQGLSQEELGQQLGVTRQTVSKWETGQTSPEVEKLTAMADLFEMSVDQLLGREEESSEVQEVWPASESSFRRYYYPEYEYISPHTLWGLPLVHIHLGRGLCKARGVLAVGNIATGVIALGGISAGLFSLGGVAAGGLVLGGLSIGGISLGGIAVGGVALGGAAIGRWLAIGGAAAAGDLAIGAAAAGHMAVGEITAGTITFTDDAPFREIIAAIQREFPRLWRYIGGLLSGFVS